MKTTVMVKVEEKCKKCGRELSDACLISGDEIRSANLNVVVHSMDGTEGIVRAEAARRGWLDGVCGRCRDQ